MKGLMHFESWIEKLVHEPFVRLFAGRLLPQDVAAHLVRALEDGERIGADGVPEVPGRYRISLNAEDLAALKRHHPDLDVQLARALEGLATGMHVRLREPPDVILCSDDALALRAVRITPADRTPADRTPVDWTRMDRVPGEGRDEEERTRDLDLEHIRSTLAQDEEGCKPAYLIIQGERTFELTEPIVRVGRALDNDLILEDRRISRYHVRLRRRYGRYILQDLGSSGGSRVNGFPIQEIVLRPGDLISLAGLELIYGEDENGRPKSEGGTTKPYGKERTG